MTPTDRNIDCDEQLFLELFMEHKDEVLRAIFAYVRDEHDTDEVFQETFLRGLIKCQQLEEPEKFLPWMVRTAKRIAADLWKSTGRIQGRQLLIGEAMQSALESAAMKYNPEKIILSDEQRKLLSDALDLLDPDCRLTFELRFEQEMPIADVALATEVSVSMVKKRITKIRRILGERMIQLCAAALATHFTADHALALTIKAMERASATHPELLPVIASLTAQAAHGAEVATAAGGAAAGAGGGKTFSLVGCLSVFGIVFFWFMAVLIGAKTYGDALVLRERSFRLRLWLVKQFTFFYCGFIACFSTAMILVPLHSYLGPSTVRVFKWSYFAAAFFYAIWLRYRYHSLQGEGGGDSGTPDRLTERKTARRSVFVALGISGALLLLGLASMLTVFVPDIHLLIQSGRTAQAIAVVGISVFLCLTASLIHFGTFRHVVHLLEIAATVPDHNDANQQAPPQANPPEQKTFRRLLIVAMMISLGPSLLHLLVSGARWGLAGFELGLFSLSWFLVYRLGCRYKKYATWMIIATLLVQFLVFVAMRELFWLTP